MCGISGFWQSGGVRAHEAQSAVSRMADTIQHRGPDDEGVFVEPAVGIALGFRRLAILDLTPRGHQPMTSPSGRFQVVFNGEIYNHHQLRRDLEAEGFRFWGRSDTEALVAGFDAWGIEATLRRTAGMFAIAAWDGTEQRLTLARDRIGIKPLYVYHEPGFVSFGSELKALAAGPRFRRRLDEEALQEFTAMLYVPGPRSIWRDVMKLPPGVMLEITDPMQPLPSPRPYWSMVAAAMNGRLGGHVLCDDQVPAAVEDVLCQAVSSHLESDVPLGAFLSGGIDSTVVVALMRQTSGRAVRTFTVRFDDPVHDEAAHAEVVAAHLGTEHTTIPIKGADALDLIPRLVDVYDEPFADASQLPWMLISAAARRHVTVVLTGDGGDELFAGYNRYLYGHRTLGRLARLPRLVRQGLQAMIDMAPAGSIDRVYERLRQIPGSTQQRLVEEKARKLSRLLPHTLLVARYQQLVSTGLTSGGPKGLPPSLAISKAFSAKFQNATLLDRMMLADQLAYLPDDQMTKVDRASMSVGLEARVPLLDHRVAELAWQLPQKWLVRGAVGKWALREVAYKYVPRELLDRPKTGFSVPLAGWLRGPLRQWAESLLDERELAHGPLPAADVLAAWRRLCSGHDDAAPGVWASLMFVGWSRRWLT